ncbi:MAG: hypothetical protein VKL59_11135 [Nostocaceae cyanobacterium]|nr:hypothetical protein [Nostocaceae cyanobacterium]
MGHGAWGMGHWALGIGHWVWGMDNYKKGWLKTLEKEVLCTEFRI